MRTYRKAAAAGNKVCNRCNRELPATPEIFLRDKSRHDGLAYECRECHRARKLGRENRTDRWSQMTDAQRASASARNKKYSRTDRGRAVFLRKAYQRIDSCDLTSAEVYALILQPCIHCGTTENPRGLDRIDNALPHVKGNVAPSCAPCNFARGDRFTFAEMRIIGATIRKVLMDRRPSQVANVAHLENSPNPPPK
jgi:hypothetical protein